MKWKLYRPTETSTVAITNSRDLCAQRCFNQREVGTELEGKIYNTDGHLCARCDPGLLTNKPMFTIQSKNYRAMQSPSDLRQFWKDFDHPYPPPGDDTITTVTLGNTVKMELNEPVTTVVYTPSNVKTPDPKTEASAVKFDSGKTDWSLMPFEAVEEINKVLEFGAKKYAAHNWTQGDGFRYTRVLNSLFRHLFAWSRGEDLDPESGLSHLAHAGCNIIFLIYYNKYKDRYRNDDRFKR